MFVRTVCSVVALIALSGCSDVVPGSPSAGESPAESPTKPRETRPRELSIDKLNACALLTGQQQEQLRVEPGKGRNTPITPWETVPTCMYHRTDVHHFYTIYLDRYYGVDYWVEVLANVNTTEKLEVAGFPAVKYMNKKDDRDCGVVVGVAEQQQVNINFTEHVKGGLTREQMCQNAMKAAEMAVTTLETLR